MTTQDWHTLDSFAKRYTGDGYSFLEAAEGVLGRRLTRAETFDVVRMYLGDDWYRRRLVATGSNLHIPLRGAHVAAGE